MLCLLGVTSDTILFPLPMVLTFTPYHELVTSHRDPLWVCGLPLGSSSWESGGHECTKAGCSAGGFSLVGGTSTMGSSTAASFSIKEPSATGSSSAGDSSVCPSSTAEAPRSLAISSSALCSTARDGPVGWAPGCPAPPVPRQLLSGVLCP